jgi:tripartite-type tricarboxylate transporter receptor subunit TctC
MDAENWAGAGGNIGADAATKFDPHGCTLLASSVSTAALGPHLHPCLGYDSLKDLVPVARTCRTPKCIVARPALPVATCRRRSTPRVANP